MASERSHASPYERLIASPVAVIVVCAVALTFLGLTVLFSASISLKQDPYYYIEKQVLGVVIAGVLCYLASRIDLDYARKASVWIAAAALLLLALVLVPHLGVAVKGSRRWLGYGAARLQVSEFAKLAMVFCLAHYLALNQTRIGDLRRGYIYPLGIIGAFSGLILLEPDFGTAALALSVGLLLLFLAGAKWRYILPTIALSAAAFATMVAHNANRLRRFTAFMDVEGNKQGGTYQLYQSLEAFAAGGTAGAGLGQGRQQINFLPEAHTDFIFAVIGEELGLAGTTLILGCFVVIGWRGLRAAVLAPDRFGSLLALGLTTMVTLQALVNVSVVISLLPTKGIPLPLVSNGGSSLIITLVGMGMLLNISQQGSRAPLRPAPES